MPARTPDGPSPAVVAFAEAARLSHDAILLVTVDGEILAYNQAAWDVVGELTPGGNLHDLVAGPDEALHEQLRYWARSGEPMPGALTFADHTAGDIRCRCRGARFDGEPDIVRLSVEPVAEHDGARSADARPATIGRERGFLHRIAEGERNLEAERLALRQLRDLHVLATEVAEVATLAEALTVIGDRVPRMVGAFHATVALPMPGPLPLSEHRHDAVTEQDQVTGEWYDSVTEPVRVSSPPRPLGRLVPELAGVEHDAICVPLIAHGVLSGRLLLAVDPGLGPGADDPRVSAVARVVGSTIARTTLLEHAQRTAELLQRRLLPKLPEPPGLTIASRYIPGTDQTEVGGDWYDVFTMRGGAVGMVIGDVAGHGLPQATMMAELRSALRAIALDVGDKPGEAMARMQRFTLAYLPDDIVTMCYLVLDRGMRRLRYVNAGHLPPLLLPAGRKPRLLESALAPPLGVPAATSYEHAAVSVSEGDTLTLYTDGLVERRGESLTEGLNRLLNRADELGAVTPDALCTALAETRPTGGPLDDLALLTVRID